jgi:hypothetical protein
VGLFWPSKKRMKVTYYLGAGASFNAIPIVGELDKAFKRIENLIDTHQSALMQRGLNNSFYKLRNFLQIAEKNAKAFGTIDTYAKHLWLSNPKELKILKKSLSLFFTIWQECEKAFFNFKAIRENDFEEIDHRYLGLLANYLEKSDNDIVLNKDIKFISWNYDNQLEKALSLFTGKNNIEYTLEKFGIYPYNFKEHLKSNIIHLNGISGLFAKDSLQDKSISEEPKANKRTIVDVLEKVFTELDSDELSNSKYFTFAWEDDEVSLEAIKQAADILNETEVLIIIGYSFPTFNDQIDKKLMSIVRNSEKLTRVYYQDPKGSTELLYTRFGISEQKIKIVNEVDQFTLPLESHSFKPFKETDFTTNLF